MPWSPSWSPCAALDASAKTASRPRSAALSRRAPCQHVCHARDFAAMARRCAAEPPGDSAIATASAGAAGAVGFGRFCAAAAAHSLTALRAWTTCTSVSQCVVASTPSVEHAARRAAFRSGKPRSHSPTRRAYSATAAVSYGARCAASSAAHASCGVGPAGPAPSRAGCPASAGRSLSACIIAFAWSSAAPISPLRKNWYA
mmetsp:Transcript_16809/g.56791  ORF Transcript_16809/g.56791 Transcript_16809/m.56791 type:complete len:201 (-) Transcript_16809:197-799(-)